MVERIRSVNQSTAKLALICVVTGVISAAILASHELALYLVPLALCVVFFVVIVGQHPEWGLLLAILLIVVQRSPELPGIGPLLTVSEVVFVFAALAWLAQNIKLHLQVHLIGKGLLIAFLFYIVAALLSLLNPFPTASLSAGFSELLARVYLMLFLVVVASYATTLVRFRRIALFWIASGLLIAALAFIALLCKVLGTEIPGLLWPEGDLVATFRNPQALAIYAVGTLLTFLPLALARRAAVFPRVRRLARWSLPGLFVAIVISGSQTSWIAVVLGILCWPFLRLSRRLGPVLVIAVLVASVIGLVNARSIPSSDGIITRTLFAIGYETYRLPTRIDLLEARFQSISDRPITGVGIGQAGRYALYDLNQVTQKKKESHYTILGIAAETGALGLLTVGVITLMFLGKMNENAALKLDGESGWLELNEGLTMAFVGTLIMGLTQDVQTNRTMWLVLTLIVALRPAFLSTSAAHDRDNERPILTPGQLNNSKETTWKRSATHWARTFPVVGKHNDS